MDLNKVVCVIRDANGKECDYVKLKHFTKIPTSGPKPSLTSIDQVDFESLQTHIYEAEIYGKFQRQAISGSSLTKSRGIVDTYYHHKVCNGESFFRRIRHPHNWEVAVEELLFASSENHGSFEIDLYVAKKGYPITPITVKHHTDNSD